MTNKFNEIMEDLKELTLELSTCQKNSTVYALDFAFDTQKELHKKNLTPEQSKVIEKQLYEAVGNFSKKCWCKKYK